jgi:hypothetical protein
VADISIWENRRIVSDLISKIKGKKLTGILLLIDFEKAFESLEWTFVEKTLKYFKFGNHFRKWVNIVYNQIESCIINNGYCSERFQLGRGA